MIKTLLAEMVQTLGNQYATKITKYVEETWKFEIREGGLGFTNSEGFMSPLTWEFIEVNFKTKKLDISIEQDNIPIDLISEMIGFLKYYSDILVLDTIEHTNSKIIGGKENE